MTPQRLELTPSSSDQSRSCTRLAAILLLIEALIHCVGVIRNALPYSVYPPLSYAADHLLGTRPWEHSIQRLDGWMTECGLQRSTEVKPPTAPRIEISGRLDRRGNGTRGKIQ